MIRMATPLSSGSPRNPSEQIVAGGAYLFVQADAASRRGLIQALCFFHGEAHEEFCGHTLRHSAFNHGHVFMKTQLTGAVAVMLSCGCASVRSSAALEPDQTFIDIFAQYNTERRSLQISELERTLGAWIKSPTDEARQRAERAFRSIDVSRVMSLLSGEAPSARSLHECLRDIVCGSYALATMKSWAIAEFTPICVGRAADGRWVELHYRGTSEDGMSGYGEVDFVQERAGWKISFESFGGNEESRHNKHLQPTCEDASG
jgi:hypothetical protein